MKTASWDPYDQHAATYRHGEAPPTQHVVTVSITFYRARVNFATFNNSLSLCIPLLLERK